MTKKLCLMLAVIMMLFTACGNSNGGAANGGLDVESGADLLNQVWATYGEEEKFPAMGGDATNMVDSEAGSCDLSDTESLNALLHIPANLVEQIDEASSIMHAMNANTFTGAAYHLKEGTDAEQFVTELKDGILSTQWMCGFPEKVAVYTLGDYVVAAFGNGEIMDNFDAKLTALFEESISAVVQENIQ